MKLSIEDSKKNFSAVSMCKNNIRVVQNYLGQRRSEANVFFYVKTQN